MRRGAADYIATRNGKLAMFKMLNADGNTHVARILKQYFRTTKTEYVISVPAVVTGKKARGKVQNRRTKLPIDMLGIGRILQDTS